MEIIKHLKKLESEIGLRLITDKELRVSRRLMNSGKYEEYD